MLRLRLATVAVGAPLMLVTLYAGGLPWAVTLTAITVWASLEVGDLFVAKGAGQPARDVLVVAGLAGFWLAPSVQELASGRFAGAASLLLPAVAMAYAGLRAWSRGTSLIFEVSAAGFAFCYVGVLMGFWWLIRSSERFGWPWSLLVLTGTWATDTGAYLVGRMLGRRRLVPQVSPSKTVEGALGGLVVGVAAVTGLGALAFRLPVWAGLGLGTVTAMAAEAGDLAESALKRDAQVKDSGWLLPGHGGILDRMDSALLSGVAAYVFMATMAGL